LKERYKMSDSPNNVEWSKLGEAKDTQADWLGGIILSNGSLKAMVAQGYPVWIQTRYPDKLKLRYFRGDTPSIALLAEKRLRLVCYFENNAELKILLVAPNPAEKDWLGRVLTTAHDRWEDPETDWLGGVYSIRFKLSQPADYDLLKELTTLIYGQTFSQDFADDSETFEESDISATDNPDVPFNSLEEWRASFTCKNPLVQRLVVEYPEWLQKNFGDKIEIILPKEYRLKVKVVNPAFVGNPEILAVWFNAQRELYAAISHLTPEEVEMLGQGLSKTARFRGEISRRNRHYHCFYVMNEADYKLLQEMTGRVIERQSKPVTKDSEEAAPNTEPYQEPPFDSIRDSLEKEKLRITPDLLRRYHLALKTRGFVILSGVSGTGKTWLAQAYAKAVGAKALVVPVAPNWNSNEDLLGFYNPITHEYNHTDFSYFLKEASKAFITAKDSQVAPQPYHLILDEMNLARVEYYFAKFLSAMELKAREGEITLSLGAGEEAILGTNLFFIGTVNIDETTHGFADKVYDRAQLIHLGITREQVQTHLGDAPYSELLLKIWDIAFPVAPFAFRTLDEIKVYVQNAEKLNISWKTAFDEQILQKVLPKLKGSDLRLGATLENLMSVTVELPLSHAKIKEMKDGFDNHGFASYF